MVPGSARVGINDRGGAAAAALHLLALGHRRFAILSAQCLSIPRGGPLTVQEAAASRFRDNRERLHGYLETLDNAGIDTSVVPIWETSGISREDAMTGASELLDRNPTALLCMSDELALAALTVAKQRGIDVPGELSIVGFDDTPVARWSEPALTTVHQDLERKGRVAGELALRLLAGERAPRQTILDVELIVRASTAPPP